MINLFLTNFIFIYFALSWPSFINKFKHYLLTFLFFYNTYSSLNCANHKLKSKYSIIKTYPTQFLDSRLKWY